MVSGDEETGGAREEVDVHRSIQQHGGACGYIWIRDIPDILFCYPVFLIVGYNRWYMR